MLTALELLEVFKLLLDGLVLLLELFILLSAGFVVKVQLQNAIFPWTLVDLK